MKVQYINSTSIIRFLSVMSVSLLLFYGCDSTTTFVEPESIELEAIAIDFTFPADLVAEQGNFIVSGMMTDEGAVEEMESVFDFTLEDPEHLGLAAVPGTAGKGERILRGAQGSITIKFEGIMTNDCPFESEGAFEIVEGTGAYANLIGQGYFRAWADGDGVLKEAFTGTAVKGER